jgi:hypothetical protein
MTSELRWMQPAGSAPVDFWTVYRDGVPVVVGVLAAPDSSGVHRFGPLPGWPSAASYTLTASNAAGESGPSNALELPEPGAELALAAGVLGLLVLARARRASARS